MNTLTPLIKTHFIVDEFGAEFWVQLRKNDLGQKWVLFYLLPYSYEEDIAFLPELYSGNDLAEKQIELMGNHCIIAGEFHEDTTFYMDFKRMSMYIPTRDSVYKWTYAFMVMQQMCRYYTDQKWRIETS